MSFGKVSELKTAVAARLVRSDMTSMLGDFLAIAHLKMMRGHHTGQVEIPPLRTSDMLQSDPLTPVAGVADLTSLTKTWLELKTIVPAISSAVPLRFRAPETWGNMALDNDAGTPSFYTVIGSSLKTAPASTNGLTVTYYAELATPAADNDTNFIFTKSPMAYLYGMLVEAYDQIRQHDRARFYEAQFAGAVKAMNDASDRSQISGGELVMMPDNVA